MKEKQNTSRSILSKPDGRLSPKPRKRLRAGFSLTELTLTVIIALIVVLAVGTVIADGVRGWNRMYARVNSDIRNDSFVARKTFDRVIRNATRTMYLVDPAGTWIEVYYHSTPSATMVDRYARFFAASGYLLLEEGTWVPGPTGGKTALTTKLVCQNVLTCIFKADGRSAQMILSLHSATEDLTVVTSAVMHNGK